MMRNNASSKLNYFMVTWSGVLVLGQGSNDRVELCNFDRLFFFCSKDLFKYIILCYAKISIFINFRSSEKNSCDLLLTVFIRRRALYVYNFTTKQTVTNFGVKHLYDLRNQNMGKSQIFKIFSSPTHVRKIAWL